MNRGVIVVVAVLVVAIAAYAVNSSSGAPSGTATAPVEIEGLEDANRLTALAQPAVMGSADAPIRIIEFGDYGCPACGTFYMSVKPQIDLAFGQAEDVAFVYYDFPIMNAHPHAFLAARAARCAGDQGRYWEYHGALFENQQEWSLAASAPVDRLESYADDLGLDGGQFSSCLRSDAYADVVTANLELGRNLGVSGTPTVIVADGSGTPQRLGNSFAEIEAAVTAAREALGGGSGSEGGS